MGIATKISSAQPRDLRYEPTPKWIRGKLGDDTTVDSRRALLVWDPDTVVPGYAFPRADIQLHKLPDGVAKEYDDADLADYVAVPFHALDTWFEEEEQIFGHPRDPFKRIDVRRSSRHVAVELDGEIVADSRRARFLFETGLPVRYYLPREDVRMERLTPTDLVTWCAYKGQASYWSVGEHENVAWTYADPLPDAPLIQGLIAFLNERCEISIDGEPAGRPSTQWS